MAAKNARVVCGITICLAIALIALNSYLLLKGKNKKETNQATNTLAKGSFARPTLSDDNEEQRKMTITTASFTKVEMEENGCKHSMVWWGDGFCDQLLNNQDCDYDGGDCCIDTINFQFCLVCICHLDGKSHYPETEESTTQLSYLGTCPAYIQHMIGDGLCDDWTNKADCGFDGGDCCLSIPNHSRCFFCQCIA